MTTTTTTKCQTPQNDVASLWNSISTASLRRILISTLSCGRPKPKPKPGPDPDPNRVGSERLGDLLNLKPITKEAEEVKWTAEMESAVRWMKSEKVDERENGAKIVRRLAKEDGEARLNLAMLGAIPPLIAMIDDHDENGNECLVEALYALLNLGIGNDLNKAAIVQEGAVHKMLKKINTSKGSLDLAISEAIVANFLALSALDSNKPILGTSGAIPFLVNIIKDKQCAFQARQDALRALYNLSISPSNIPLILDTDLTHFLINTLGNMEVSDRALSILSNVVSTPEGRRAISQVPDAFPALIDVLNWTDSPGCQEKASYVLMIMAHKSYSDRQRMTEAGIGSALLELTLLGSTLAQKRASRILECLRLDKGKQVSQRFKGSIAVSAPISGHSSKSASVNKEEEGMMSEEKKAVKQLVEQSLENNLRRIVRRANLPQDFVPSEHLKSLTGCSTSKSLPF